MLRIECCDASCARYFYRTMTIDVSVRYNRNIRNPVIMAGKRTCTMHGLQFYTWLFKSLSTRIEDAEVTAALLESVTTAVATHLVAPRPADTHRCHGTLHTTRPASPAHSHGYQRALRSSYGCSGLVILGRRRMPFIVSRIIIADLKPDEISPLFQTENAICYKYYLTCGAEALRSWCKISDCERAFM